MFVGGHGDWNGAADGGAVRVITLCTGEIQTDGGIAPGTPDLISGGTGTSLVQGQQVQLSAIALSIKPGGRID